MSILDPWRRELRALIPQGFLRRDQGDGLFVSDAPRLGGDWQALAPRLLEKGYTLEHSAEGLWRIGVTEEKMRAFLDALSYDALRPRDETLGLYALGRRLEQSSAPLSEQSFELLYRVMKYLDAGEWAALDKYARETAAVLLRRRRPLPGAAGKMILWALALEEGAETEC